MTPIRTAVYASATNAAPYILSGKPDLVPPLSLQVGEDVYNLVADIRTFPVFAELADAERRVAQLARQVDSLQQELANERQINEGRDTEAQRVRLELEAESIMAPALEPAELRRVS